MKKPGGSNWSENEATEHGATENLDAAEGDAAFQEVRNKKATPGKEKIPPVGTKSSRMEKRDNVAKERKVKSQPYEARSNPSKDLPPRFSKVQQPGQTPGNKPIDVSSSTLPKGEN